MNGTTGFWNAQIYPAAMSLLPSKMDSLEARALLIAIAFQESGFVYRRQVGGPAHGFWQFEEGGINGVLGHHATKPLIDGILPILHYSSWDCYRAITDNDILATIFARLLLWSYPAPLPLRDNPIGAWNYYLDTWRPGKPRVEVWEGNFTRAWEIVAPTTRGALNGP